MSEYISLQKLQYLQDKVVMVTGASRNFGREIAEGFAECGATVILTSRELTKAEEAAAELAGRWGITACGMALDLNSEESVNALYAKIKARFGVLDVLVNNAGGHSPDACGFLERETLKSWQSFIDSNLTGTFLMLRGYAQLMMEHRRGCVINIASISSLVGRDRSIYPAGMTPNPMAYTAAKAGMIGLSYDAAAYLGAWNIRVNAISPGGFERTQPKEFIESYSARTMLGRMGNLDRDLKGAAVFLATDAAGYITGHNLVVDGGFTRYK